MIILRAFLCYLGMLTFLASMFIFLFGCVLMMTPFADSFEHKWWQNVLLIVGGLVVIFIGLMLFGYFCPANRGLYGG